jgi:hypothetical protein
MNVYEVTWGDWDEVIMVVLARSEEEVKMIIKGRLRPHEINDDFERANIDEILNDLTKPGVLFRYDR